MRALHRKLWRELWQLRGQVVAIALVTTGGIGTVIMAVGNHAALTETRALYYAEYRFADVFVRVRRAPLALVEAVRDIPGVRDVQARASGFATLELEGYDEPVTGQLTSLAEPGDPDLGRLFLRLGELPQADDEVVVNEPFADAHGLRPGDALTAVLNGRRERLRISGVGLSPDFVYPIRPGDAFPDFERFGVMWMARAPLARAFDLDGAFNELALSLSRDANESDVVDALDRLLEPYGSLGAHGRELQLSHRFLDEELTALGTMARLFGGVFLTVTAFLLNVVLGRLIAGQREQIAVLKAFGYGRTEVAVHYAQLALATVAVGIGPGLLVGAWLGRAMAGVYAGFYSFPYLAWRLEPWVVLLAVGFAGSAAALGTAGGLVRAFRLSPAEAMRPESPPSFRPALAERLGLGRVVGPVGSMVLRNLERRPWRSLLSVVGIALAGGILVMSRFQAGAIGYMVDVQFGLVERDDLEVSFVEPTSRSVLFELAALPGVARVEPLRHASVRLVHGHREHRTTLRGLEEGADLHRVLDRELRAVALPRDGVLLTDHLAGMLDLAPGQSVGIEFLEGARRVVEVTVAGVVDEFIGVAAYADLATVNRLAGEGDAVTGALLALADPSARVPVVRALRGAPRVAAITDHRAMVASFEETMARTILTFTLVASLLGACVTVGVVYNAARITLAERGREFASLRVLGYTRREVGAMLLGELFTLSFAALVPGALVGWGMATLLVEGLASDLFRIPLVLTPSGFAFSALIVLAATAFSAVLVRRRLDSLDLVAVLKARE